MSTRMMLGFFFIFAVPAALTVQAQECPNLVWSDEFDGTSLNLNNWEPQIGDGCNINLCGWGNNEKQYYKAENATVSNGTLKITAKKERVRASQYTSARLRTINLGDWTYGRFEAMIRLPIGDGLWPAFWMLPTDEVYGGWPMSGEIDIMESRGQSSEVNMGTIHFGEAWPDNRLTGEHYLNRIAPWSDGFHRFAIEWEPEVIRWYVDDVLYSTKTTADLRGRAWPFDQRFHFLINVAVGGTLGGTIDDSIFPVDMEADWVRVWDKGRAAIDGPFIVHPNSTGVTYSVVGEIGTGGTYNWTVPAGATLVSGQGSSSIVVDWGTSSGTISADVSNSCLTRTLHIPVFVEPARTVDFIFEDFEANRNLTLTSTSGTLNQAVSNPDASGVNTSTHVAQYTRNAAEKYDTIVYGSADLGDADLFTNGTKKFYLDVYTSAPVGTQVTLGLEDASAATASNYPSGRHSSYTTRTSIQNAWERLEFEFEGTPDGATAGTSADQIVLLFDSAWNSGDTYYFDNLTSNAASTGGGTVPAAPSDLSASAPSSSQIDLSWTDNSTDEDGFGIERSTDGNTFSEIQTVGAGVTTYSDTGLSASTTYSYRVRAFNSAGHSSYSNTASATTQSGGGGSPTTMHVEAIDTGTSNAGGGQKHGTATVTVHDDLGGPVSGATVTGTFSGDFNETKSGTTATDGTVTLTTTATKRGGVSFTFCVDDITHASLTYNAAANVQTCSNPGKRDRVDDTLPQAFALDQNYPNPFNPTTVISFDLPEALEIRLAVYNTLGKEVAVLATGVRDAGEHVAAFDAAGLPSGIYAYKLTAGTYSDMKLMTLLR